MIRIVIIGTILMSVLVGCTTFAANQQETVDTKPSVSDQVHTDASRPTSDTATSRNASTEGAARGTTVRIITEDTTITKGWLGTCSSLFQILFFTIVGTVTLLTYLKVRDTLLQPIRTEVFKEQLKQISAIMSLLAGKGEAALRDDFGFDRLFEANSIALLDEYAETFFNLKIDREERPYGPSSCPAGMSRTKDFVAHNRLCDEYIVEGDALPKGRGDGRAMWAKHKHVHIYLPMQFCTMEQEFQKLIGSPLIPERLRSLLLEYRETVNRNVMALGDLLTECAQQLPDKYPTLEMMRKASISWIHVTYVRRFESLEEKAREITGFIRSYFGVDAIARDLQG